jgi:hypothetical protein
MAKQITDINDIKPGDKFYFEVQNPLEAFFAEISGADPSELEWRSMPFDAEGTAIFERTEDGLTGRLTNPELFQDDDPHGELDEDPTMAQDWESVVQVQGDNLADGSVRIFLVEA